MQCNNLSLYLWLFEFLFDWASLWIWGVCWKAFGICCRWPCCRKPGWRCTSFEASTGGCSNLLNAVVDNLKSTLCFALRKSKIWKPWARLAICPCCSWDLIVLLLGRDWRNTEMKLPRACAACSSLQSIFWSKILGSNGRDLEPRIWQSGAVTLRSRQIWKEAIGSTWVRRTTAAELLKLHPNYLEPADSLQVLSWRGFGRF